MKRKRKFDYSKKSFKNPFRSKTKKKIKQDKAKFLKIAFFSLTSITLTSLLFWFFIFSNFWILEKIEISDLSRIDKNEVKKIIYSETGGKKLLIIPANNILFINKEKLEDKIKNKFHFENIKVSSEWPDMLNVEAEESPCNYILKQGDFYHQIDSNNYIITSTLKSSEEFKNLPLVNNKTENEEIKEDSTSIDPNYINYIKKINLLAKQKNNEFKISEYILDEENTDTGNKNLIKAKIENGPIIYFNIINEPGEQLNKLLLVKNELKNEFWEKNYINLEFGDKVFYQ